MRETAAEKVETLPPRETELPPRIRLCAGKRVLVVDGDNFVCELMSRLLRNHLGLEVATAGSGRQAIAEALTGDYHAAIIDLLLPRTSGLKAIKAIKEMKPDFPIIALTSDLEEKRSDFAESSGVARLFSKPVRIPVLLEELMRILSADRTLPVAK